MDIKIKTKLLLYIYLYIDIQNKIQFGVYFSNPCINNLTNTEHINDIEIQVQTRHSLVVYKSYVINFFRVFAQFS